MQFDLTRRVLLNFIIPVVMAKIVFLLMAFAAAIASVQSRPAPMKRQAENNSSFTDLQYVRIAVLMSMNVG